MNRKAVLIVDDEADIRELLVLTLGRMGVEAVSGSTPMRESVSTRSSRMSASSSTMSTDLRFIKRLS